jgi:hypothetical protein
LSGQETNFFMLIASFSGGSNQIHAGFMDHDSGPDTDPTSSFWFAASAVFATSDTYGEVVPGHKTEIRARWTVSNLYFLFTCPYEQLDLKPNPTVTTETNELWNWDVAEVFIGSDFENIRKYKEFEISPQGEWIDLDIDLDKPDDKDAWLWNSGFEAASRIDSSKRIWYGFMRIPYASIDHQRAAAGNLLRVNFYRGQGPAQDHKKIAWQPTSSATFHVPESFGTLKLVKL